jgi:hypothetical protein
LLGRAPVDDSDGPAEARPAKYATLNRDGGLGGATELAQHWAAVSQIDALSGQRRSLTERAPHLGGVAMLDSPPQQCQLQGLHFPHAFVHPGFRTDFHGETDSSSRAVLLRPRKSLQIKDRNRLQGVDSAPFGARVKGPELGPIVTKKLFSH